MTITAAEDQRAVAFNRQSQPELSNSWLKDGNGYDDPDSGSIAETLSAGNTNRNAAVPGRKS